MKRFAMLNGILVFAFSAQAATAAMIDTTTLGSWIGVYGSQGYILNAFDANNDLVSFPTYVNSVSYSGNTGPYTWDPNTSNPKAVDNPLGPTPDRVAATQYNAGGGTVSVTLNLTQYSHFHLGIYSMDWDNQNRINDIFVPGSPTETVPFQTTGVWTIFTVDAPAGPFTFSYAQNALSGSNATISAIVFDAPEPSSLALLGVGVLSMLRLRRRGR